MWSSSSSIALCGGKARRNVNVSARFSSFLQFCVLEYPRLSTHIMPVPIRQWNLPAKNGGVRTAAGQQHSKIGSHEDELWPNVGQYTLEKDASFKAIYLTDIFNVDGVSDRLCNVYVFPNKRLGDGSGWGFSSQKTRKKVENSIGSTLKFSAFLQALVSI